jgi:hypothetical protein
LFFLFSYPIIVLNKFLGGDIKQMKSYQAASLGVLTSILEKHPTLWEKIGPHVEKAMEEAMKAMTPAEKKEYAAGLKACASKFA